MRQTFISYLLISSFIALACGAEFQVNTHTSNNQANAAIAMGTLGNSVVVWSSYGQDGSSNGVFAQRFDPNCSLVGEEFQVNTTTSGNQTGSSVAMDAVGNFVVAWHGPGILEEDREDIFAQRFDADGQPIGHEFRVNTRTEHRQRYPKIAMNGSGAFAVVWESETLATKPYEPVVSCQLYDANGLAVGVEFETNLLPDCRYPDVAMDGNGDFAIVWMQDESSNSAMARLYYADGSARTEPFEVSTIGFSSITPPTIAMNDSGRFVVAWDGDPERAGDDDIHARLYEPNGTAVGEQFVVNTTLAGPQQNPQIAMNDRGEFAIVWDSRIDPAVNEREIFGQRFNSLGDPIGDEFQVNIYMLDDQKYPAVAIRENGQFVTAWQSEAQDGSRWGIFADVGRIIGSADFTGDGFVDFHDYSILAEEWLRVEISLTADLTEDNKIDEQDLAEFCHQWLTPGR